MAKAKPLFTDAELDKLAHHLETAADCYLDSAHNTRNHPRLAEHFRLQSAECRELRRRIDSREREA